MNLLSEYAQQLKKKQELVQTLFAEFNPPDWAVFSSVPHHYRMRTEFRVWHERDTCCYAMFVAGEKPSAKSVIRLTDFAAAHTHIRRLMPLLLAEINQTEILKNRLYQVDFLTTQSDDNLITLIYHKKIDDAWHAAAIDLARELNVSVVGRSRGQKVVLNRDYVIENLCVNDEMFVYRQPESAFSQPNAGVCEKMLAWVQTAGQDLNGDLLELYCGNGNFTMPLSRVFRRVLATEISKTAIAAAQWNKTANKADNVAFVRLSAEEFTQAYRQERVFQRLNEQQIDLSAYQFSTVLVDPPRAGIDDKTLRLLQQFDRIIYISCNPYSLHDNIRTLSQTHRIHHAALFDQFPFTPHIETGLLLGKKSIT
ncbi:tRNA (uridine(54)-C5)-methyltransferase TrmA [Stenoxybacter acetivorans]|uniref:tRNA (uridine(54)-C5)-methyltransferase TrmA n=1 Tax=Stenoxybacter acetivorans TaxID=422441 RepID=UPI000568F482|nr:tRNA (uridine(54)-C5)-methyltransferase TrmA [Stenoxybacter acetivorans]